MQRWGIEMRRICALAATAGLAFAHPAMADQVIYSLTGTFGAFHYVPLPGLMPLQDSTSYEFLLITPAEPSSFVPQLWNRLTWDNYDENGQWIIGNDLSSQTEIPFVHSGDIFRGDFRTPTEVTYYWPNGNLQRKERWTSWFYLYDQWADVSEVPFTFTLSVVPEPATWGLMILGFGLAGTALRRRSAAQAA
jgi:hypothetical protein